MAAKKNSVAWHNLARFKKGNVPHYDLLLDAA
jgi:hypothetical protein